jgi:hypothetical protein
LHTGFWCGNLREIEHLQTLGLDESVILRLIIIYWDGLAWTGLIWLRIRIGDGNL